MTEDRPGACQKGAILWSLLACMKLYPVLNPLVNITNDGKSTSDMLFVDDACDIVADIDKYFFRIGLENAFFICVILCEGIAGIDGGPDDALEPGEGVLHLRIPGLLCIFFIFEGGQPKQVIAYNKKADGEDGGNE